MESTLITVVLLNIPTSILFLYAGLGLMQVRLPLRRVLLWGALPGILIPFLRAIPPFGVHVPIALLIHVLLLRYLSRGKWAMCLLGALLPNLLMVVAEGLISLPVIYGMMGLTLAEGLQSPWVTLAGGWLSNIFVVLVCAYFCWKNRTGGPADA